LLDCVVRGAIVIDGTGLPRRRADIGIQSGRIVAIGRVSDTGIQEIDADGLIAMPGIVDAHTHYDPLLTFDPWATSACFHGVTTVVTANCGFSVAPCAPDDRAFTAEFMAAVEGFSADVLREGLPWSWESFPSYLDALDGHLGINTATYIAHSALRRFVMGERASTSEANEDELAKMEKLVTEARAAGACGFSTERMGAELDHLGRPTPSVVATEGEVQRLIEASGGRPTGSLAVLPLSAGDGLSDEDGAQLRRYALSTGLPVIVQGIGWRPGMDAQWAQDQEFFERSNAAGAAIFSLYRNHPMVRPFDFERGTSLFKGVEGWRDFANMAIPEILQAVRSPEQRERLRWALDHPITDPAKGATTPPPPFNTVFVEASTCGEAIGKSIADLANEGARHPSDALCDLLSADELETKLAWRSETEAWRAGAESTLRHPNILIGTGDGGAHSDRDDGSEWSTYFLSRWVRDRGLFSIEEGVRRITSVPAQICGLTDRGMLAPGYGADLILMDLDRLQLTDKYRVHDLPAGGERWRAEVEGIEMVFVNGRKIVEKNELTRDLPGVTLRGHEGINA
jgi:N-acyl-D-aspartate/D-glutamate deacylase